jgi:hypothetical protein
MIDRSIIEDHTFHSARDTGRSCSTGMTSKGAAGGFHR